MEFVIRGLGLIRCQRLEQIVLLERAGADLFERCRQGGTRGDFRRGVLDVNGSEVVGWDGGNANGRERAGRYHAIERRSPQSRRAFRRASQSNRSTTAAS